MSFSDVILILALIGCITILYKKRQERKATARPSRFSRGKPTPGRPTPKAKKPFGVKY